MFCEIEPSLARSRARMPRTSTPAELNGEEASACPSTIGAASRTPGISEMRLATGSQSVSGEFERLDQEMPVEAKDLVEQLDAEPVHYRHDDNQGCDPEHDPKK